AVFRRGRRRSGQGETRPAGARHVGQRRDRPLGADHPGRGPQTIMKISRVECLPVHSGWRKNFVFVRIETDVGTVGWGEAYSQYDRARAIAAQVEEWGRYLIGRDPFHIRHILQIAFDDYAQRRGSLEFYCATSGIEQALWDIAGKVTRQPVYNLLGGPC